MSSNVSTTVIKEEEMVKKVAENVTRYLVDALIKEAVKKPISTTEPKTGPRTEVSTQTDPVSDQLPAAVEGNSIHARNSWKAGKTPEEIEAEEQVTLKLLEEFRGILNKITPENSDEIVDKIKALNIDTVNRLQRVVDLGFDKAILDPSFCVLWADLCQHLSQLAVETINEETGGKESVKFSRLLLAKCQKDFDRDIYENVDIDGKMKAIEEETDDGKQKLLVAELDEEKREAMEEALGNIRLMGELYRIGMLKGGIMVNCMHMLINDLEDDSLERLCTLLMAIGAQLEKEFELKQKHSLDPYFNRLKNVVQQKLVGPRVQFLIQDILDMRDRNWQELEHEGVAGEKRKNVLQPEQVQQTSRRPIGGGGQRPNDDKELNKVVELLKSTRVMEGSRSNDGLPTPQPGSFSRWGSGRATATTPADDCHHPSHRS